jgi:hypothetical protein
MQAPLVARPLVRLVGLSPSDPGIVSSQILVAVVWIAPTARRNALFRSTESCWPRCSLILSYRGHPTIWLVKTMKSRIVKPPHHRKRFLLRRGDLSGLTFALGYDAISPSGRTRSSIHRCVLIRAQLLVEIGYLQVLLCGGNHAQHDRPIAVNAP